MFNFFKKIVTESRKDPIKEFWNWFLDHKSELERFVESKEKNYDLFKQLNREIKKYHPTLHGELTMTKEDKYVMIITPDGKKEGVIPTQELAKNQPKIDNWIIKKFRQPRDELKMNFNGIEYPSSDIEIYPELVEGEDKVDIDVYIKNMNNDEKKYQALAFLYLDHIIGEFNTITKVRYIDFLNLNENESVRDSISILELRKLIENKLY